MGLIQIPGTGELAGGGGGGGGGAVAPWAVEFAVGRGPGGAGDINGLATGIVFDLTKEYLAFMSLVVSPGGDTTQAQFTINELPIFPGSRGTFPGNGLDGIPVVNQWFDIIDNNGDVHTRPISAGDPNAFTDVSYAIYSGIGINQGALGGIEITGPYCLSIPSSNLSRIYFESNANTFLIDYGGTGDGVSIIYFILSRAAR